LLRKKRIELTGVEGCGREGCGEEDGAVVDLDERSGIDLSGFTTGVEAGVGVVTDPVGIVRVVPLSLSLRDS
jgi:hypothetical protein